MSESDEPRGRDEEDAVDNGSEPTATDGETSGGADEDVVDEQDVAARIDELESERDALAAQVGKLREERDDLKARLKRTAADFENYKKRQQRQREQLEAAATERLVDRLLDVRDNLNRALDQEADDVEALREGVKLTLAEFDRVLDAEDVSEIDPEPGAPVEPERHEVVLQVESEHPKGHIDEVYQMGYETPENVLRAAKVTVSEGDTDADHEDGSATEQ